MNESYYPWQFGYQVVNHGFVINLSSIIPIELKKTPKKNKQKTNSLSLINNTFVAGFVFGIIHPPKVYKAFFFFLSFF